MTAKLSPLIPVYVGMALLVAGCTETAEPIQPPETPSHVSASGLVVRLNSVQTVRVDSTQVSGILRAIVNETGADFRVSFLDSSGREFTPSDSDYRLGYEVANTAYAAAALGDSTWEFHLTGYRAGQTSLRLQIVHGDHLDYRSPPIPVQVDQSASPQGMVFRTGGIDVVIVDGLEVSGELAAVVGQETAFIDVYFVNGSGSRYQPEDPSYTLGFEISDPTKVELIHDEGRMWGFRLRGIAEGTTGGFFTLLRNSAPVYEAPEIPVVIGG